MLPNLTVITEVAMIAVVPVKPNSTKLAFQVQELYNIHSLGKIHHILYTAW